jgi:outer membrane immunogenic protein
MRRILLSTVALGSLGFSGLGAYSALAADLPSNKAAAAPAFVAPAQVYNWSGLYVGAYGGGVFGSTTTLPNGDRSFTQSPRGGAAGGLVGYTYQFNPHWALGLEGEGGWQGASASSNFINGAGLPFTERNTSNYVARVRGRVGYALDRALIFVAGGVSFADDQVRLNMSNGGTVYSKSGEFTGWNIGGGVDYAFTPNWIGRVEYIYDGFVRHYYGFNTMSTGVFPDVRVTPEGSTVRAALIYKFGAPEPVGAKY